MLWQKRNIFPKRQILDSSELKELADDNFKFDEHDRKLSKRVENTVRKGEIARYEQFLLFPQCFRRLAMQIRKIKGLFGTGLKNVKFVGKGENAFSPFPTVFSKGFFLETWKVIIVK